MLIGSQKHSRRDLEIWNEWREAFAIHSQSPGFLRKIDLALSDIGSFTARHECYCGVSWGKDSTVIAHMVALSASVPLCWIRVEPIKNPECVVVRDVFLKQFPVSDYYEIERWCAWSSGEWHATGTLESGAKECQQRFGRRYILGIRGDESSGRKLRCKTWGAETENTLAPLAWWTVEDVFAYLVRYDLPIHPVYAMNGGGRWHYSQLRTASLGGRRGDGMGRAEWEKEYYGSELRRLATGSHSTC